MRKIYVMKSESSHPQWTGGEEVEKEVEKMVEKEEEKEDKEEREDEEDGRP